MTAATPFCPQCGAANARQQAECSACGQTLAVDTPETFTLLPAHFLLHGRYRILRVIGQGGFGVVYQAEDMALGNRVVAIKELRYQGGTEVDRQAAIAAFQREARLLAGLSHPNLPHIDEHFSLGGRWYLVMEYILGQTLEQRLTHAPDGQLSLQEALEMGRTLCRVFGYLHTRQPPVVFRDLKPANVMLTSDGGLYVLDFGLARHFVPGKLKDTIAFGSPGYAAPEQYGKAQTTPRSDIYSLGVLLHRVLSGSDPATTPFVFEPLPPSVPPTLVTLLNQMLQLDQRNRPATIEAVRRLLGQVEQDLLDSPPEVGPGTENLAAQASPVLRPLPARASSTSMGTLLQRYEGHRDGVQAIGWAPDGRQLASAGSDETLQVWEALTGRLYMTFQGYREPARTLSWAPNGHQIASGGEDAAVRLWDLRASRPLLLYRGHALPVTTVGWSPDGAFIASGSLDGTVQVWSAKTLRRRFTYQSHTDQVTALAWSPEGDRVASGTRDGRAHVWAAGSGAQFVIYRGHVGAITSLAWSPDGRWLVSGGVDHTVQVWNGMTGAQIGIYRGHRAGITAVAWSPDGKQIACSSLNHTVQTLTADATSVLWTYQGHTKPVLAVAWSPDGTSIASAGEDHTIHLWQVATS